MQVVVAVNVRTVVLVWFILKKARGPVFFEAARKNPGVSLACLASYGIWGVMKLKFRAGLRLRRTDGQFSVVYLGLSCLNSACVGRHVELPQWPTDLQAHPWLLLQAPWSLLNLNHLRRAWTAITQGPPREIWSRLKLWLMALAPSSH